MRVVKLKSRTSLVLFIFTAISCILSAYLLYFNGIGSFYFYLILAVLTILVPLASSLYLYKGRPARLFFILGCLGIFLAVIFAVDAVASQKTFEHFCNELGNGHQFETMGPDYYVCTAPSEGDYVYVNMMAGMAGVLMYPYLLIILLNALHIIYLPFRLLFSKAKKHTKQL